MQIGHDPRNDRSRSPEYANVWFYVSTAYWRVGGKGRRYYLLTKPSDLILMIEETGEQFWIERVMIVTPPRMNGTGKWEMSQLKELIAATDTTDLTSVDYIYQLTNDSVYASRDISDINTFSWRQTLYSEEQHAIPEDSDQ